MEFSGSVQFPRELDGLSTFRRTIHTALAAVGADTRPRDDAALLLSEVCTAALARTRHGLRYQVSVVVDERSFAVNVAALPSETPAEPPEDWDLGVATTLADEVTLTADEIHLVKKL